jgi:hypothetical protein
MVATNNAGGGGGRNAPGSPFAVAGGPVSGEVDAVNRRVQRFHFDVGPQPPQSQQSGGLSSGASHRPCTANQPAGTGGSGISESANNRHLRYKLGSRFEYDPKSPGAVAGYSCTASGSAGASQQKTARLRDNRYIHKGAC